MKKAYQKYFELIQNHYVLNIIFLLIFALFFTLLLFNGIYNAFSIIALFLCVWSTIRIASWKKGAPLLFGRDVIWGILKLVGEEEKYESISFKIASVILLLAYPSALAGLVLGVLRILSDAQ